MKALSHEEWSDSIERLGDVSDYIFAATMPTARRTVAAETLAAFSCSSQELRRAKLSKLDSQATEMSDARV